MLRAPQKKKEKRKKKTKKQKNEKRRKSCATRRQGESRIFPCLPTEDEARRKKAVFINKSIESNANAVTN